MPPAEKVIQATCPNCQKPLRVPESLLGQTIRCKACSHTFEIRSKARPVAPSSPIDEPTRPAPPLPARSLQRPDAPMAMPVVRSAPESRPGADPVSGFAPAFGSQSKHKGGSYKPGRGRFTTWILLGIGGLALSGAIAAAVFFIPGEDKSATQIDEGDGTKDGGAGGTGVAAAPKGPYPRRLLAISVNNYIFANPVSYGDSKPEKEIDRRDTHAVVRKITTQWKIPTDQVYELTDGAAPEITVETEPEPTKKETTPPKTTAKVKGKTLIVKTEQPKVEPKFQPKTPARMTRATDRPPFQAVIEKTVDLFLSGCREQDRIIVLFTGHAIEKDGEAYLVPLEGDMEEVKTLVPVKAIYEKLGKCKAQQKIVIFDICRNDPARGAERPTAGPMTEALEKILHAPPAGVAVWTSCSKDQSAFEEDYGSIAGSEFWGSLFMSQFFHAARQGMYARKGKQGGLSAPEDPFPIESFADWVTKETARLSRENFKVEQTPKFTPAAATANVAWNPTEKSVARFEVPAPPLGVPREQIASIFKEINLPSLKAVRKDVPASSADATFPFSVEAMDDYKSDGVTLAEMKANPKKYAVRLAVVECVETIRKLRADAEGKLPETIGRTQASSEAFKKSILDNQTVPAEQQAELREALETMDKAAKEMGQEKSKRWLVSYEYVYAQIKIRIAYLEEYNLAMGKVRKDELPALEGDKASGWQLSAQEKMNCQKEYKDMAAEGREKLEGIVKNHPDTPWAMLAKREKNTRLGLSWQPRSSE